MENVVIINTIRKLKKRKAPSLDGVQAEALQFLSESMLQDLRAVFHQFLKEEESCPTIWKREDLIFSKKWEDKDPKMAKSYQPICLLRNTGKL